MPTRKELMEQLGRIEELTREFHHADFGPEGDPLGVDDAVEAALMAYRFKDSEALFLRTERDAQRDLMRGTYEALDALVAHADEVTEVYDASLLLESEQWRDVLADAKAAKDKLYQALFPPAEPAR